MIAIKDMEMPSCCVSYDSDNDNYVGCPFYKICEQRETIRTNYKPNDCPLTEIVTCKDCKHWHDDGIMTTCDKNIGHGFPRDHFCEDGERRE